MVNENIQGAIPLSGRGMIRHKQGEYTPGDFSTLVNAEVSLDGAIVTRRPYFSCAEDGHQSDDTTYVNFYNIVGHYKDGVIVSGQNKMGYLKGDSAHTQLMGWGGTEVTGDRGGNCKWSKLVGFVRYNHMNYWLFLCNFDDGAGKLWFEYWIYFKAEANPLTDDILDISTLPTTKVLVVTTDPTATQSTPVTGVGGPYGDITNPGTEVAGAIAKRYDGVPYFRTMFIHKERLWIVTNRQVLFSKATDPAVWLIPEGGFFNFDEKGINDAVALNDSIHVVCDNTVHVINYSTDPNALGDVTVKEIASSQGGDAVVAVGDVVYFARENSLYSVVNNQVTRVLALDVRYNWSQTATWRLVPFGNYIVAMYSIFTNNVDYGVSHPENENAANSSTWDTDENLKGGFYTTVNQWSSSDTTVDGDVFFINTENGAIHGFSIPQEGYVVDAYLCPVEDTQNRMSLYIMTRNPVSDVGTAYAFGRMFVSEADAQNTYYDHCLVNTTSAFAFDDFKIYTIIEMHGYQPDGSSFFMKKFRNLLIEGEVPNRTMIEFNFSEINTSWTTPIELATVVRTNNIYPFERRIAINQRSRSLSFKIYPHSSIDENYTTRLCLNRLVALWTYTGRGPVSRDGTVGRDSQAV